MMLGSYLCIFLYWQMLSFSLQLILTPNCLSLCWLLFDEYGVLCKFTFFSSPWNNRTKLFELVKSRKASQWVACLLSCTCPVTELGWAVQNEMLPQLESTHGGMFGGQPSGCCCRLLAFKPGMVNRLFSKLLLQCWSVVHRKQALFWLVCLANWYFYNFMLLFCTPLLLWD